MPWQKGQSGNPKGRHTGVREAITQAFLREVERHWRQVGPKALEDALAESPNAYCRLVLALLPKDVTLNIRDETLADILVAIANRPAPLALEDKSSGLRNGGVAGHA